MIATEAKYSERVMRRIGQRFGRWTITGIAGYLRPGSLHFHAKCDCGCEAVVSSSNLYTGKTTQCDRCGIITAHKTRGVYFSNRRQSIARINGRDVLGWRGPKPLFKCDGCENVTAGRWCRTCARSVPRKGPKVLRAVAAEFGVSKQYVSLLLARMSWREMVETLKRRNEPKPTAAEAQQATQKKQWAYTRIEQEEMYEKCRDYLQQNKDASWEELWWSIPNHYKNPASMLGAMGVFATRNGREVLRAPKRGEVK